MKNFKYDKQLKGTAGHYYSMYTIKWDLTNAAGFNYHLTIPWSDVVAGNVGSYPHITVTDVRNQKKKWTTLAAAVHWYVVWIAAAGQPGQYAAQDSSGGALNLTATQLTLFGKCVEDMKEIGGLPWVKDWTEKWNGS